MMDIASYLEHTCLKPDTTQQDVDRVIAEAKSYGIHGICVPPFWVRHARREIGPIGPRIITVVGFPLGYQLTETKIEEMMRLIDHGADELDVVWNLSAFKTGMPWAKIDLARCTQTAHANQRLIKIILETSLLSDAEITEACQLCSDAGADFVKTSTGFGGGGATVEHIQLMRSVLPANVGIKASGGIRTKQQALDLIRAGADRIGTSAAGEIAKPAENKFKDPPDPSSEPADA